MEQLSKICRGGITLKLFLCAALFLSGFSVAHAAKEPKPSWTVVESKLRAAGLSRAFVDHLRKHYQAKTFTKTLRFNHLLFRRATIRENKITPLAIRKTSDFVQKNKDMLSKAEKRFGVPKETIAALLWLETQHGVLKGEFHVASVFVHVVQSSRPDVQAWLVDLAKQDQSFADLKPKEIKKLLAERAQKKFKWALEELKELQEIFRDDREYLIDLHGSFAGAFGMPQFLPSSYNSWALSADKHKEPDLYDTNDAIMSVANYLRSNGWRKSNSKTYTKALLKYNNSKDYAATILELSRLARDQGIAVYQ